MTTLVLVLSLTTAAPVMSGRQAVNLGNIHERLSRIEAAFAGLQCQGASTVAPTCTACTPTTGSVGTSVTCTGDHLGCASGWIFGTSNSVVPTTTPGALNSASAVVPADAATGGIRITTSGGTATCPTFTVGAAVTAPVISSFAATPISIAAGQSATLAWSVSGATSLSISGIGAVTGTSRSVTPSVTTSYTLTATNAAGSATASVTVTVAAAATITSINPTSGQVGTEVQIVGTGFTTCGLPRFNGTQVTQWGGNGDTYFIATVPAGATTGAVTMVCTGGTATGPTFTVQAPPTGLATIAIPPWSDDSGSGHMTVAQVSGRAALTESGSGDHYLMYQLTTAPTLNQPYIMSARVQAGSCSLPWLQIQTYSTRYAQCTFDLATGTIYGLCGYGGTGTITSAGSGKYDIAVTGVFVTANAQPGSGLPYYLVVGCGTSGAATSGVALYVDNTVGFVQGAALPTIASFGVSPTTVNAGQAATLSWSTTGANTVTIDNGVGTVAASGSAQVVPASTTTYTLTATNGAGPTTGTATLTVVPAGTVATPTFSPGAGTYSAAQTVTISDATSSAVIHYTTNGVDPTCASTTYSGALTVSATQTLKAIGCLTGMTSSSIATAAYTISGGSAPGTGGTNVAAYLCPSGGTCIGKTVTGGGSASDATLIANSYNVVTEGGATGDCSTDDTTAIRTSMATATSQGKALYFPTPSGGCYLIHGSDTASGLDSQTSIRVTTHMVGAVGTYPRIQMIAGSSTGYGGQDCNQNTGSGWNTVLGIYSSTTPIIISGLTVDGGMSASLTTEGGYTGTTQQNCWAWDSTIHLYDASNVTIRNSYVQYGAGDGIEIDTWSSGGDGGTNVIIDNNTVRWNARQAISASATGQSSGAGTVITNNVISNLWGYGGIFDGEPNPTSPASPFWNIELAYNQVDQTAIDNTSWGEIAVNWDTAVLSSTCGNLFSHGNTGDFGGGWCYPGLGYNSACSNVHACVSPGN